MPLNYPVVKIRPGKGRQKVAPISAEIGTLASKKKLSGRKNTCGFF